MNRLEQWLKSSAIVLDPPVAPESSPPASPRREAAPTHQLFLPEHYEKGYAYPLIVWLHGAGRDEEELWEVLPHLSPRNYVGVAPRGACPSDFGFGFTWCDSLECVASARKAVDEAIEFACRRSNIAPHRIFLAGRGKGGTMALRLALAQPERFAGVLSFGGGLPRRGQLLANLKEARKLPIFLASGCESVAYPVRRLCDDLKLCHLAWLSLFVKQYYPCGDEMVQDMLDDANEWIMQIVTGATQRATS